MNEPFDTCTNCEGAIWAAADAISDADGYNYCSEECRDEFLESGDTEPTDQRETISDWAERVIAATQKK